MGGTFQQIVERLLEPTSLKLIVIFTFVIVIVLINAVAGVIKSIGRERSRREIAAYIAEGSMSAKDGERLMKADPNE